MAGIVVMSHKNLPQPDDDLVLYLNNNCRENVAHIFHGFSDCPNRISVCRWYKKGKLFKEWKSKDFKKFPEIVIYLKEFVFTILSVLRTRTRFDTSVCMDGMCTFFGIISRFLGRVKKVNYWAIDFVPKSRFNSGIKNFIYHKINIFGYRKADEMWDLSPRMADAREEFLGIKKNVYRKHRVVPYGVWTDRIKRYSYDECEKNTLVFMGHLLEKQGVQLVLDAIPEIVSKIPDFKFKIIGTGSYEGVLKEKVEKLGIQKYVKFMGKIEKNEDLEEEIAKSCVAIAPYIAELDKWTKYADPGKVKTYLACGVPVLLTDVPWNAREIERRKCGKVISNFSEDMVEAVFYLMGAIKNDFYRKEASRFSDSFNYLKVFRSLEI